MLRILLAGGVVAAIYLLLPQRAEQPQTPSIATFGVPWTYSELIEALEQNGLSLDQQAPSFVYEDWDGEPSAVPLLISRGNGSVTITIYASIGERQRTWPDNGRGPLTRDGGVIIAEGVGYKVDNVVLFRGARGDVRPLFGEVEAAVDALDN